MVALRWVAGGSGTNDRGDPVARELGTRVGRIEGLIIDTRVAGRIEVRISPGRIEAPKVGRGHIDGPRVGLIVEQFARSSSEVGAS